VNTKQKDDTGSDRSTLLFPEPGAIEVVDGRLCVRAHNKTQQRVPARSNIIKSPASGRIYYCKRRSWLGWVPILASYPFQLVMHEYDPRIHRDQCLGMRASVSTRKVDPSVYSPVRSIGSVYTRTVIDVGGDVRAMHARDRRAARAIKSAAPRALSLHSSPRSREIEPN
jgi:hypothetical protein